jgi:hypothetical protein
LRLGSLLIALTCFALSPTAQGVTPAPDGGYPNANTAEGTNALFSLETNGVSNTAIGFNALFSNATGVANTAVGSQALYNNNGFENTATGSEALFGNTNGTENTATGSRALHNNSSGNQNTATGWGALFSNTTGSDNTATGNQALTRNTTGSDNTANGFGALNANTTGNFNTATGDSALEINTTGILNTANGGKALFSNTTGFSNTATGFRALSSNTTGGGNTANGRQALSSNTTGGGNTANGFGALASNTTGKSNIALGGSAGTNLTTGSNNIDIGNIAVAGEANTIRIGNAVATVYPDGTTHPAQTAAYIAGIHGVTVASAVGVVIDVNGHLGTVTSSARFKEAITPMDKASEAILALKPVSFRYKKELDPEGIPQFGLVAEQVEKVNPDLVARDAAGKVYTVRYEAVNAMLLNEFLKEHRRAEEQRKYFEAKFAQQQKQIETLTAGLQKVSDQMEPSRPAPQVVANNQ